MFLKTREAIPEAHRVYVDETGFDAPLVRPCGYSRKGEKVMGEHTGKRFPRTSVIAGLKENQVVAPMGFKGYRNTEVVLSWVKEMSLPQLEKGDRVIWDNASFHKSSRLAEALEEAEAGLLFLPPYSPDLNPIEQFWEWVKSWIRALNDPFLHISQALVNVFGNTFN